MIHVKRYETPYRFLDWIVFQLKIYVDKFTYEGGDKDERFTADLADMPNYRYLTMPK